MCPQGQAASLGLLDSRSLDELRTLLGGEPGCLVEVIDAFLEEGPKLLAKMRKAVEDSDAATLRITAHSLKSNSARFGAIALHDVCKTLEAMARANELAEVMELVNRVELEYPSVKTALEALRNE